MATIDKQEWEPEEGEFESKEFFKQWAVYPGPMYGACPDVKETIPSGIYNAECYDRMGTVLVPADTTHDSLLVLPDNVCERVLEDIKVFWSRRDAFHKRGQLFKRGILLYGPAGSGKTSTIFLLSKDIIRRGGIVLICKKVSVHVDALSLVRKIEPQRPIVSIMEDIDEMIDDEGERTILSLLDGESQIEDVVHIATTNFPERLDPRIIKRPSRFDEVILVDMPSAEARRIYLQSKIARDELSDEDLTKWVAQTEGMSVAYLREMVVAVFCLGKTFDQTIERLKEMNKQKKPLTEFDRGPAGFLRRGGTQGKKKNYAPNCAPSTIQYDGPYDGG